MPTTFHAVENMPIVYRGSSQTEVLPYHGSVSMDSTNRRWGSAVFTFEKDPRTSGPVQFKCISRVNCIMS